MNILWVFHYQDDYYQLSELFEGLKKKNLNVIHTFWQKPQQMLNFDKILEECVKNRCQCVVLHPRPHPYSDELLREYIAAFKETGCKVILVQDGHLKKYTYGQDLVISITIRIKVLAKLITNLCTPTSR